MYETGHLHLVCGLICAGKSTLCNALAVQPNTVLLGEDHWLKTLYGPEMQTVSDYVTYSKRLQNLLASHVANLLQTGATVVLDFPANTLKQRSWLMAVIEQANCQHTLHVLDVPIEDCKARLFKRNAQRTHQFTVSEEQFDRFSVHFVSPTATEGFNIETHLP